MASATGRPDPNESHKQFYLQWITTQEQELQELQAALVSDMKEEELVTLVSRVLKHYREYYEAKESAAKKDVLEMMSPSWKSPLENAFLWLGGCRPTMVLQLAYAEAGHQLEVKLANLLQCKDMPTMAALSSEQLAKMNDLQLKTRERERELSHRTAVLQQAIANEQLVTLAQIDAAGDNLQGGEDGQGDRNTVGAVVNSKLKPLQELLVDADALRYETLDQVLKVLTVFQSGGYLIAAGQLHICIRRIGQFLERNEESF